MYKIGDGKKAREARRRLARQERKHVAFPWRRDHALLLPVQRRRSAAICREDYDGSRPGRRLEQVHAVADPFLCVTSMQHEKSRRSRPHTRAGTLLLRRVSAARLFCDAHGHLSAQAHQSWVEREIALSCQRSEAYIASCTRFPWRGYRGKLQL